MSIAKKLTLSLILMVLASGLARAQQPDSQQQSGDQQSGTQQQPGTPDQPQQPTTAIPPSSNTKAQPTVPVARSFWGLGVPASESDPSAYIPDTRPLSGSALLTAGQPENHVNLFDMSLNVSVGGGTGLLNSADQSVMGAEGVVGGDLSYAHMWRQNSFGASYDGGGTFFDPSSSSYGNGMFHSLTLGEQVVEGRWKVRLTEDALYSTNADVGGAGLAGPGLLGDFSGPFSGLIPDFGGVGETIISGLGRRMSDTSVADVEYDLSPGSALTVTGSYDLLHFFDAGFIDSRNYFTRVGYDLGVSTKSMIAFYGQAGRSNYGLFSTGGTGPGGSGTPPILANATEFGGGVAYSQRVTGRMAFQVEGGPDYEVLPTTGGAGSQNRWLWDVAASLSYQSQKSTMSLSYFHGPTQGSGVFSGSSSQVINAGFTPHFTRFFTASLSGGYTRNNSLVTLTGFSNQYSNWYASASVVRQLGRSLDLSFFYGALEQYAAGACPVASCALPGPRQTFGVGLAWHPRPISVE